MVQRSSFPFDVNGILKLCANNMCLALPRENMWAFINDFCFVGVTKNASIYSHPILQYQEGKEEIKDGSNLLVQYRVRKGVGK